MGGLAEGEPCNESDDAEGEASLHAIVEPADGSRRCDEAEEDQTEQAGYGRALDRAAGKEQGQASKEAEVGEAGHGAGKIG